MKSGFENREPFLFLAGSWFGAAFSVPAAFFWTTSGKTPSEFLFFIFPAVTLAFLCGEAFGSDILDAKLVQSPKEAAGRGLKIALLTYCYFAPVISLSYAVYLCMFFRDEHEWLTVQFIESIFLGLYEVAFLGFLACGWLLAILGALAGWSLYQFRSLYERP